MTLFGVRDGSQVAESSPSLKGEGWIRTRVPKKFHLVQQTMLYAFSDMPVNIQIFNK